MVISVHLLQPLPDLSISKAKIYPSHPGVPRGPAESCVLQLFGKYLLSDVLPLVCFCRKRSRSRQGWEEAQAKASQEMLNRAVQLVPGTPCLSLLRTGCRGRGRGGGVKGLLGIHALSDASQ